MANEIYHRSNWGNAVNDNYWADVYEKYSATNKMFIRSDYYENSNVTDKLMADIYPKPSILLTPTAYDNGKLNSVKPVGGENLLVQSNQFDTTWVNNTGGSIVGGQEGYDGSNNAWQLNKSAESYRRIQQSINLSGIWTFSVYAKAGSLNIINLRDETNAIRVEFNLSNGTVTQNFGAIKTNVENIGDGWYRCSATYDRICAKVQIYLDWNQTTAGNVYIQNAQVEKGLKANTYIETTTTAKANGDFNFSRGSSATRVNEKGLIEDVQILSGNLVQNGDFEQIGGEEVSNGGFDSDSDWITNGSIANNELTLNGNSTSVYAVQSLFSASLYNGKILKLTYTIVENTLVGSGDFYGGDYSGGSIFSGVRLNLETTVGIHNKYIEVSSSGNNNVLDLWIPNSNTSGSLVIDNVSVKEVGQNWEFTDGATITDNGVRIVSDGTLQKITQNNILTVGKQYKIQYEILENNSGNLKLQTSFNIIPIPSTVGIHTVYGEALQTFLAIERSGACDITITNVSVIEITDDTDLPRINYTNGEGSLLLEPQSTNLLTYSEDFSSWSISGTITQTNNYGISPDGKRNSTRLQLDNNSIIYRALQAPFDGARSLYVKATSGSGTIQLLSHNTNTDNIFTIDENWQRVELNDVQLINQNFYLVDTRGGSNTTIFDIEVWGAQYELLDYATSYIPTNGSTVTRLADECNNAGSSDLINSTEGVLYFELKALMNGGSYRTLGLSNSNNSNAVNLLYRTQSNQIWMQVRTNNVETNIVLYDVNQSQNNKIALSYKENDFRLWVNGIEKGTNNNGLPPIGLETLKFSRGGGGEPFYGNVKCVAVFKEALNNDELERLTGEGYETFKLLAQANNYTII